MASRDYNHLLKLVLIGDTGVGKSCLLLRFADDTFTDSYISTIGVDFRFRTIDIDGKIVKLQIWDTAGQERFKTITSAYYRGADGIVIVYDCTNEATFASIDNWVNEVKKFTDENVPKILVGCKNDLRDKSQVTEEMISNKAKELGIDYVETSAKDATNVQEPFIRISQTILKKLEESMPPPRSGQEGNVGGRMNLSEEGGADWASIFGNCC
eukprot:Protomagalhaensia_sp_Gyna_25__4115@NODE_372_length_3667_cov_82_937431_g286_i0_p2_GENE_NODE_372_length_3667_cov_82_937431_g286_i0NODE_372_length_3667_cov_82_937431_g286_i0_p2_ORF_typecomplete_len212_score37_37Ras/PF00071_22/2_7e65Roc/PF08477_13/1_7e25Arf/PF00025_21/8_4e17MMR_HSR1/PF01926_23/3_4e07Gtr1_RagA/PF04670_12/4_1e07RsgA_GTPase/PF03193_16/1_7RsgA_GTPase/PF03193_16/0_005GTP_EFTU/PF00009_27/8_6e06SRPRB/PF09439_10/9_5e06FeoB_N/PF02421_18/0_00015Dynamin_N/PF00350_23/2_9Dynamin_N/PF00350_23/5_7